MKSIYASKLYKASTRKDRIHAALMAPGNLSLVQQLAESLDEEYQKPENLGLEENKPKEEADTSPAAEDFISDEEVDPEKDLMTVDDVKNRLSYTPHSKPSSSSSDGAPAEPDKEKPEPDTSELIPDSPMTEEPKPEPAVENKKEDVESTTLADVTILKGTLNSREDTAGVTRVAQKENEVWIYYKDDVNLNNVMTEVIEYIMNSGWESFEFNRLARSDNAIVFEVTNMHRDAQVLNLIQA